MRVVFSPEVEDELAELIEVLVSARYLGTYDAAVRYVSELIRTIEQTIAYKAQKVNPFLYPQYRYVVYRKSHHTYWYVFFRTVGKSGEVYYLVEHITNNHRFH